MRSNNERVEKNEDRESLALNLGRTPLIVMAKSRDAISVIQSTIGQQIAQTERHANKTHYLCTKLSSIKVI